MTSNRQRALEALDNILRANAAMIEIRGYGVLRPKDTETLNSFISSTPPKIEGLEEALSIDSGLRISADVRAIEQAARAYLELTKGGVGWRR